MKLFKFLIIIILPLFFTNCSNDYIPKPRGFFRISFPEKSYTKLDSAGLPYNFEIPVYSKPTQNTDSRSEKYWIDLIIPEHKAEIHVSYKVVNGNLRQLTEDARKMAYKHTIKADAIEEQNFINFNNRVFGTIFLIEGNAASPLQFYLTDSTSNFIRGAFYIREIPNIDSIKPVIEFIKPDIINLIETTEWRN